MSSEDLKLVQRAVAGDEQASHALSERIERTARLCLRDLASRSPALRGHEQDLAQQLHMMLLENDKRALRSYQGRASLTTWLNIVAKRFFIRCAQQLPRETLSDVVHLHDRPDPSDSPERRQERRAQAEAVQDALSDLSDEDQLMLALLFEQEAPASEVGKLLGLTASGVRMKKLRLLRQLAKRLKKLVAV